MPRLCKTGFLTEYSAFLVKRQHMNYAVSGTIIIVFNEEIVLPADIYCERISQKGEGGLFR